jgi:hypothetical protein
LSVWGRFAQAVEDAQGLREQLADTASTAADALAVATAELQASR